MATERIELVTPAEAAGMLGTTVKTLATWRCTRKHHVPYVKVSRRVMYPVAGLRRFIEARTVFGNEETE